MLGDLMIDVPKEREPVGASDFPFPEGQNDLTEVTPTQRGQVPILTEMNIPSSMSFIGQTTNRA